ncbi:alkene reductase [Thalassotalea sp. PLHSN55]|uniref:alkene reductase n=1 Tax=Thalassotalea sp. PLHSN55 TaxID=3435888 RepID=UPI003F869C9F
MTNLLFQPITLGQTVLKNRIVMAPLTRSFADEHLVPTKLMADYYGRRADAGLIISEAILVSKGGQGYPNSPGIYNQAQIEGWQKVTKEVHNNDGKIFAQLWHTGRLSHSIYREGQPPIAPSNVGWTGRVPQTQELYYHDETPIPMDQLEINRVINAFAQAAKNARQAGFDGIEVHGANGYLIDQFLHCTSNTRTDNYGGNAQNMCRFLFEIIDAIQLKVPNFDIALRLSVHTGINEEWQVMKHDDRDRQVFEYLLSKLNSYNLAYVHKGMYDDYFVAELGATSTEFIGKHYHGKVMACGGYSPESANESIKQGTADLVAFGRPFIANHDFVSRVKQQQAIKPYAVEQLATLY